MTTSVARGPGNVTDDVQQFLRRCRDRSGDTPAWVAALRRSQPDLAAEAKGRPWLVEVRMPGARAMRLGITAEGEIVCPLPPGGVPDVRIEGEAAAVAGFVLGQQSLEEAMLDGLLVVPSGEIPLDVFDRLRRLAATELGKLAAGPAAGLIYFTRRCAWRAQSRMAQLGALLEGATPVLFAAAATMVMSSALAAPYVGRDRPAETATARTTSTTEPLVDPHAPAGVPVTVSSTTTRAASATVEGDARVLKSQPSAAALPPHNETVTTAVDRGNILRTGFESERPGPGGGATYLFIEMDCSTPVRQVICDVMRAVPVLTQDPQE